MTVWAHSAPRGRSRCARANAGLFEDAYYRLRASVIDNGLDWSKPLAPQIAATQNRSAQKPQTPAPMTNGRPAVASTVIERDQNPFSPEGGTTDDIVKAAMREAGINFE